MAGHELPDREALLEAVGQILEGTKKLPSIRFFSLGWRDSSDVLQPVESTLSKEQFGVKSFY
jgi:hypothetical protein